VAQGEPEQVVAAEGVDPLQATPLQAEQAQSRFARGKTLLEEGKYQEAADEFQASRSIVASPNARLYRARCLVQLERLIEAYVEFGRTMVQAMELSKQDVRYTHTVESATTERHELEQRLAFVRFNVHHPHSETRLFVNGEEVRRQAWGEPGPALPGQSTIELVTPGRKPLQRSLTLAPGAQQELVLDAESAPTDGAATARKPATPRDSGPSPEPATSLRPYAYGAAGVAVLGYAAFAVLGTMSESTYSDLQARCAQNRCSADEAANIDRGREQQLWANVGLGVGALATAAAVSLWLLEPDTDERADTPRVGVAFSPSGLALRGRM
jgi:tetratricopeptide (TPR) repeat protein